MQSNGHGLSRDADPATRVVLADDCPLILTRLTAMLADVSGVAVVGVVSDAVRAIAIVRELRPDFLVLDLSMPGGAWAAVLREFRSDAAAPVIVVLTNYPYPAYRTLCLAMGAQFFFDKSNEFEKVIEVIEKWTLKRSEVTLPAGAVPARRSLAYGAL